MGYFFFLSLFCTFFTLDSYADSLAERLGYSATDKVILLHADDMGMTNLTNQAVADTLDFGLVKSASVMIPAGASQNAIRDYGDRDLGIHLTLNSEWQGFRWRPVAPWKEIWSLVDWFLESKFLWRNREETYFLGRTKHVRRELTAQIEQALHWGMKPTHLDYHMATAILKKRWGDVYLDLAKKYEVPPLVIRWSDHLKDQLPPLIMNHLKKSAQEAEEAGFLLFDYAVLGLEGETLDTKKESVIEMLKNLQPGVTFYFMHPSYFEERNPFPTWVISEREADAAIWQDPEIQELIQTLGIQTIGWKEIGDQYDWTKIKWPRE